MRFLKEGLSMGILYRGLSVVGLLNGGFTYDENHKGGALYGGLSLMGYFLWGSIPWGFIYERDIYIAEYAMRTF